MMGLRGWRIFVPEICEIDCGPVLNECIIDALSENSSVPICFGLAGTDRLMLTCAQQRQRAGRSSPATALGASEGNDVQFPPVFAGSGMLNFAIGAAEVLFGNRLALLSWQNSPLPATITEKKGS